MHSGISKYLKQMERFQNLMIKRNTLPNKFLLSQSQKWFQQHNEFLNSDRYLNIQRQMDFINRNTTLIGNYFLAHDSVRDISINPILEVLDNQKLLLNQMNIVKGYDNFYKWHSSISRLVSSHNLELSKIIPDSLYTSLNELTFELENSSYFQDVQREFTIKETIVPQDRTINWENYIMIILMVLQFIYAIYVDNSASFQFEEQMSELIKQNELMEKQIEISEKQLDTTGQLLKLEEERFELQKRLEEKLDSFTESIEPFITDQISDVHDSSQ